MRAGGLGGRDVALGMQMQQLSGLPRVPAHQHQARILLPIKNISLSYGRKDKLLQIKTFTQMQALWVHW